MNERKNLWPGIIVLCLLIIFGVGYFVIPSYVAEVKDLNLEVAVTKQKIQLTEQKLQDLQYLKGQFEANKDLVNLLNLAIPDGVQLPETLVSLDALAKDSGLEITSIQPKAASSGGDKTISLSVTGSYDALKSFLVKMENNLRPMNASTISVNKSTTVSSGSFISASLSLQVYQPQAASAVSTAPQTTE